MRPLALAPPARGRLRLRSNALGFVDVPVRIEARTDGISVHAEVLPSRIFSWDGLRSYATGDEATLTLYVGHYGETLVIDVPPETGPCDWIAAFRAHGLRVAALSHGWE